MTAWAVCFIAGVLCLPLFHLPPAIPGWLPPLLLVLAFVSARLRLPAVFALGFCWAALHVLALLAITVPPGVEGRTVLIEGTVTDRPVEYPGQRLRFVLAATQLDDGSGWRPFPARVRLDWYETQDRPAAGERWQLAVRLKQPHGYANPGGFDFELWLFQKRIRATGYVRTDKRNTRLGQGRLPALAGLRNRLSDATASLTESRPSLALVQALTIGERSRITSAQWQVLRATGTGHLMAISGLHISLVAGLVFWCTRRAWSCSARLSARLPAPYGAAAAALAAAVLYALLSGFAIPAQRALIMVGMFMLALVAGRRGSFPTVIVTAALATLLLDPLAMLASGWWLSFWAVAVIAWFTLGRQGQQPRLRRWLLMPVVLAFCMTPLLLVFFQQVSLVAPLANVIAVPWVSFLVVPLALTGTLLFPASEGVGLSLLQASAWLIEMLWIFLDWLAASPAALLDGSQPPAWRLLLAVPGVALVCLPRG
ncbi:MAG: ComEC/Rec2 family competence protein, partial [Thiohalobacterales bacterium]|nr:ComEC/Rec2 family competence protein [Thiohalobacterales bacterium]